MPDKDLDDILKPIVLVKARNTDEYRATGGREFTHYHTTEARKYLKQAIKDLFSTQLRAASVGGRRKEAIHMLQRLQWNRSNNKQHLAKRVKALDNQIAHLTSNQKEVS